MDNYDDRNNGEVYSNPVRAGKRTYFFDVKATKGNDLYVTITESKRRFEEGGGYEKHKIFLYKEDFEKFKEGLADVLEKISELKTQNPDYSKNDDQNVYSDFE